VGIKYKYSYDVEQFFRRKIFDRLGRIFNGSGRKCYEELCNTVHMHSSAKIFGVEKEEKSPNC